MTDKICGKFFTRMADYFNSNNREFYGVKVAVIVFMLPTAFVHVRTSVVSCLLSVNWSDGRLAQFVSVALQFVLCASCV